MAEIKEEDVAQTENKVQKVIPSGSENTPQKTSYESLFGGMLFLCMILFVIASISFIGWFAYKNWKNHNNALNEPSIEKLSKENINESISSEMKDEKNTENETAKSEEKETIADPVSLKKVTISVLNGGGTKGSAGALATFLKEEKYTDVTIGNANSDYTGTTLYFSSGMEKEADAIKLVLLKKYPQTKILSADTANRETYTSKITIIIGK